MTLRLNGDSSGFTEIKAADAAGDNSIKLPASNGSANQLLQNGGTAGELQYTSAGGGLHYDSSGRLLVGASSSRGIGSTNAGNFQLEVAGAQVAASFVNNYAGPTGALLTLGHSRSTSIGGNTVLQANDFLGEIRFAGADGTDVGSSGASIQALVDGTPGADVMPGKLTFSTNAGGASVTPRVEIGSNGALKLLAGCPGIDFSGISGSSGAASPANNLLDDYEEGTWTPGIEGGATAGSYTVSDVEAYYTKIGNRVTVTCRFHTDQVSAGSGYAKVTGLPFNYKANTRDVGACNFRYWTSGASNPITAGVQNISSGIDNRVLITITRDNNVDYVYLPITGLGSPSFNLLQFTYSYEVA